MANKRQEERERLRKLREQQEKQESSAQRRRLLIGYGIAGILGIAVIAGIIVLIGSGGSDEGGGGGNSHVNVATGQTNGVPTDERTGPDPPAIADENLQSAAKAAGCTLQLNLKDEGHVHVDEGTKVEYKTNPPSSGNHVLPPAMQADGAYSETPEAIDYVHSLEHGRMEIEYSSDLSETDQKEIKGLYDTLYGGTLLFPNDTMPYEVAAVTWTNILGCKTYQGAKTMDAIRDFGRETWNKYGAQAELDSFPIAGPTPAD